MVRIDGAKIRKLREEKKLTQLYLSTVVEVTTDTISRWENKHYQSIKLENAQKLAEALEVPFEEILKQEEQPEHIEIPTEITVQEDSPPPPIPRFSKTIFAVTILVALLLCGVVVYQRLSNHSQQSVTATRILPPHVAPGQTFPVLIRVQSSHEEPVSLIVKEFMPPGTVSPRGLPEVTSTDTKENSLKWIRRLDKEKEIYAYLCTVAGEIKDANLVFNGTVTLKKNVKGQLTIDGDTSLQVAPFHWADSNKDYMIDDEEILAVYDTYSDIEELPFDRELIDSIWASSGYRWDSENEQFIPND